MNRFTKGRGAFGALSIGSGPIIRGISYGVLSVVHGTILPGQAGTIAVAVTGMAAADIVMPNPGTLAAGLLFGGVNPIAGTLRVYVGNITTGTIQPGTFGVTYGWLDLTS